MVLGEFARVDQSEPMKWQMTDPREHNVLHAAWRDDHDDHALARWLKRAAARLN